MSAGVPVVWTCHVSVAAVTVGVDILRPLVRGPNRINMAQRLMVEEEAAAHAVIAGDRYRERVGETFAERAVERADALDDRVRVHRVAELVIDDVRDAAGV